jgi:hypothetical protein
MTSDDDPYNVIDPVLMPWARKRGLHVYTQYRDEPVRSTWFVDRLGNQRAHMYLDLASVPGEITVHAVETDPSSRSKCGRVEQRTVKLEKLEDALEQLRALIFEWIGPGAFL